MKVLAILLIALVACAHSVTENDVLEEWAKFQVKFGKTYKSPIESRRRLAIFKDNLERIEAHNELYRNEATSYSAGINQFADWTKEEFKNYVNVGLTKRSTFGNIFNKTEGFVLPSSVDWRQQNIVTEVKDQGQCGSCWAFSTTGSLEGQYALKTGKLVSLSEQNLVDCCRPYRNNACGGGEMDNAFDYIKDNGIESEQDYSYEGQESQCRFQSSKVVTKISSYVDIPGQDEAALQEAIATKGPISAAIFAGEELQIYTSGIFDSHCYTTFLNHGVLVVGFGSENGKEFYIVKNSWGSDWGESGYFRLLRNAKNKCGIATNASYPEL